MKESRSTRESTHQSLRHHTLMTHLSSPSRRYGSPSCGAALSTPSTLALASKSWMRCETDCSSTARESRFSRTYSERSMPFARNSIHCNRSGERVRDGCSHHCRKDCDAYTCRNCRHTGAGSPPPASCAARPPACGAASPSKPAAQLSWPPRCHAPPSAVSRSARASPALASATSQTSARMAPSDCSLARCRLARASAPNPLARHRLGTSSANVRSSASCRRAASSAGAREEARKPEPKLRTSTTKRRHATCTPLCRKRMQSPMHAASSVQSERTGGARAENHSVDGALWTAPRSRSATTATSGTAPSRATRRVSHAIRYGVEQSKSSVRASSRGMSPAGRKGMKTPEYSSGARRQRSALAAEKATRGSREWRRTRWSVRAASRR
mmetsp:Transcript_1115/g.3731  ORF Transcript_1115/g.3731 Transcript_1115/m.3731 type:complete len:385 (-) Transcript_1115:251-1405(-)